jgi:site-specific recombinase XerD
VLHIATERLTGDLRVLAMALGAAVGAGPLTLLRDARLFAEEQLRRRGELTEASGDRFFAVWVRFVKYAEAHGEVRVGDVSDELVERFVLRARTVAGGAPSVATTHLRRAAVRLLFRVLRDSSLVDRDPTIDLRLSPRSRLAARPLTDDEVEACRWASLSTVVATRQPALWALGEAGASTREIAKVTTTDLDLRGATVWLSGGPRTDPRWSPLTEWGAAQLSRRLRALRGRPEALVAFDCPVEEVAGRISAGVAISAIMTRAGLANEEVKPRSLAAWAARRVWLETGRIDEAARRLGLRSLDLTAELIGFDWRGEHGGES